MDDKRVMHSMSIDDAYTVEQVLAQTKSGMTEIVTLDGTGPFIRKRVFHKFAHRSVWAALSECSCPRLPHVQASYETPDTFVVVCSYIPGQTLTEYMAGRESLTDQEATRIIENVCEAVAELHRHSVIHCDITPENIIIAADGAHVIDLGIACMEYEGTSSESAKLGTWGFAAPEQYGFANVDKRTDIYSIGRLFAYLLTGARPDSDSFESAMRQLEQEKPHLYQTIKRASCFEPSGRYQSIAAFAEDIRHASSPVKTKAGSAYGNTTPNNDQASNEPKRQGITGSNRKDGPTAGNRKKAMIAATAACACFVAIAIGATAISSSGSSDDKETKGTQNETASVNVDTLRETPESRNVVEEESVPFSITESGWHLDPLGYVYYTFAIHNDSESMAIRCPEVKIIGRDESGSVLFEDTQVLCLASPGATVYNAGITGNGTPPATVEFSTRGSFPETWPSPISSEEAYSVTDHSAKKQSNGICTFTGEVQVKNNLKEEFSRHSCADGVCITVVLRDGSGKIIGGLSNYFDAPSEGNPEAFQVDIINAPAFDSYDIYASCW